MSTTTLQNLSDEELQSSFKKHTMRGLMISISLLAIFCVIYFVPLSMQPDIFNVIVIAIAAVSVALAIWYHLGRRKYYQEFRRRNLQLRN